MENKPDEKRGIDLPPCATEFIRRVLRRMWYRRKARRDVQAELTAHFEDAVRDCATAEERQRRARELIEEFGDAKLLASLCHRAKKRCRPLWLKALLRSGQGLGLVLLYSVVCMLPALLGRPTIRVDYAAWLSDHWRPAGQGVENAKVYFDQAASAYVEPPPGLEEKMRLRRWSLVGYSDDDVRSIEQWLVQNQPAFAALRRGANTPHCWPIYDGNEYDGHGSALIPERIMANMLQSVSQRQAMTRDVTFAFKQQIIWELRRAEIANALDDCLVLRRLGRHLQARGLLIEQLAGIAIEAMGYDGITAIAQTSDVPIVVLAHVQEELERDFDLNRRVVDLEAERAHMLDCIQSTFTDDGKGGGHALSEGFVFAPGDWKANLLNTLRFRYPDRREAVAVVERHFQRAQERLNVLPEPKRIAEPNHLFRGSVLDLMLSLAVPAYEGVTLQGWRLKTHESGVITLLAIQRYFRANGRSPDDLDQVVEQGFLQQPPKDPFGQGPLTYSKTDKGFLLYSWGTNLKDDGGQWGTDSQGKPRMWADNGDWVFWPMSEP